MIRNIILPVFLVILFLNSSGIQAETNIGSKPLKILIHVTKARNSSYRIALSYIKQIQDEYKGRDYSIEVVANGPEIGLVNSQNVFDRSIIAFQKTGVKFSACNRTINILRAQNKVVPLVKGVNVTKSGVLRVIKL